MSFEHFIRAIQSVNFLTSRKKPETARAVRTILLALLSALSLSWPQQALTQSYQSYAANDNWMRQQQDQMRRQQQDQMRQQQDEMRRQQQQQMRDQQRQQMRQQQQAKQRELIRQQQQKLSNDNKQKIIRDQQRKAVNDNQKSTTAQQKARSQETMYQGSNKPTGIVTSGGIARMARPLTAGEIQRGFTGKVTADGRALIKFQNRIFTVPASRVSGLSARLAAEKQRKARWSAQLQEGVNKKIKAIAIASPRAPLPSASRDPNCKPKDSPRCRGNSVAGNEPPRRNLGRIPGCTPPESLRCQFNEAATRPGPVQVVSSPAIQARIDSARLARANHQKAAGASFDRPNSVSKEKAAELGSKLEYFLGRARGSQHNIDRSLEMLRRLENVGLPDTAATRQYLSQHLSETYANPASVLRTQENGRIVRESLLIGPRGAVKIETVWDGNRLITGSVYPEAGRFLHGTQ